MKCPHCRSQISYVVIKSNCQQMVGLVMGNVAIECLDEIEVIETTDIECPACEGSLMGDVSQI